jgi:hypothetical protein
MKKAAPTVTATSGVSYGSAVTLSFSDAAYSTGLSVYVTASDGSRTLISTSYLDRTQSGKVTIKAEYFAAASTAIKSAGTYTLELVNNSFSPSTQSVKISLNGSFSDVPSTAWYATFVNDLASAGIINGTGNGKFTPNGTLTWGAALKLLMLTTGYDEQTPTSKNWASGYISTALADGLISEAVDPNADISRLEFCQTAAKALKATTTLTESPFSDTDDTGVMALYEMGIIDGVGGGKFAPDSTLKRSEISKIIWCIRNLED